jgi:hypothetical protein
MAVAFFAGIRALEHEPTLPIPKSNCLGRILRFRPM